MYNVTFWLHYQYQLIDLNVYTRKSKECLAAMDWIKLLTSNLTFLPIAKEGSRVCAYTYMYICVSVPVYNNFKLRTFMLLTYAGAC